MRRIRFRNHIYLAWKKLFSKNRGGGGFQENLQHLILFAKKKLLYEIMTNFENRFWPERRKTIFFYLTNG